MIRVIAAAFFVSVFGILLMLSFQETKPETQERLWVEKQAEKCSAQRSNLNYDKKTKLAECWRTPFMRHPKLIFQAHYPGDDNG